MKNSEEAIEKVLAGLRNSNAPVGMERRILEALEDQASARSRSGWRRLRPIWLVLAPRPGAMRSLAWGVALAGMVAVVLAISAIRRPGHGPGQSAAQAPAQAGRNSAPVGSLRPATAVAAANGAQLPTPESSTRSRRKTNARRAGVVRDSDSVALHEMLAASHPPPPMPLTEQEKLLLRIVHKGDPEELAMLDPMLRAARDTEDKADVKKFFEPSTTGDNE